MEKNVLLRYHDQMGHIGVDKTAEIILKNYWFSNLRFKVKEHIRNCLKCITYSPPSGKVEGILHSIPKKETFFWISCTFDHLGPIDKNCSIKICIAYSRCVLEIREAICHESYSD